MSADAGLTVRRMVELAQLSRAGFYRFQRPSETTRDKNMNLRDAIQRIALGGRVMGVRASRPSCVIKAGRSTQSRGPHGQVFIRGVEARAAPAARG